VWDILTGGEFYNVSQYLVGWSGNPGPIPILLRRINSGNAWESIYSFVPEPYIPSDIIGRSDFLFVCVSAGKIFNSTDSGDNWIEQFTNITETLKAIAFWGDLIGYSVGDNGTILYTSNGGVSSIEYGLPIISDFKLEQNYPNPFNPSTIIKFIIPTSPYPSPYQGEGTRERFLVSLKVYIVLGNEIATLVNEEKTAGIYEVEFSAIGGSTSGGNAYFISSGIYFYAISAGEFVQTKK